MINVRVICILYKAHSLIKEPVNSRERMVNLISMIIVYLSLIQADHVDNYAWMFMSSCSSVAFFISTFYADVSLGHFL